MPRPRGRGAGGRSRATRTAPPGSPGRLRAPVEEGVAAPWAAVGACVLRPAAPPRLLQVSPGVGRPVATVAVADAAEDHSRLRLEDCIFFFTSSLGAEPARAR